MKFNADVWGPHYWFFLHTIANSYPKVCNKVTQRKYCNDEYASIYA